MYCLLDDFGIIIIYNYENCSSPIYINLKRIINTLKIAILESSLNIFEAIRPFRGDFDLEYIILIRINLFLVLLFSIDVQSQIFIF